MRGIAAGALITVAFNLIRSEAALRARIAAFAACIGIAAWVISEAPALAPLCPPKSLITLAACPAAGLFWLLVAVLFADRKVSAATLAPAASLLLYGVTAPFLPARIASPAATAVNLFDAALLLHAAWLVATGWQNDLLFARRRARAVVLGAGALFGLLDVGSTLAKGTTLAAILPDGLSAHTEAGATLLAIITLAAAGFFLNPRPGLFEPASKPKLLTTTQPAPVIQQTDAATLALLARLQTLMQQGAWRREGITIGALATELGIAEHRLRPLINDHLGYRNFADFLNAHRIEEAKRLLSTPTDQRNIATIAFDLGYASLGPFNRAFRAATLKTPTAWRREALGKSED